MKLAVINCSGNVGKTTVSRHVLEPRIPDCQLVTMETIDTAQGQPVTIRGRHAKRWTRQAPPGSQSFEVGPVSASSFMVCAEPAGPMHRVSVLKARSAGSMRAMVCTSPPARIFSVPASAPC